MTRAIILLLLGTVLLPVGAGLARRLLEPVKATRLLPGMVVEGLAVVLVASAEGHTSMASGAAFGTVLVLMAVGLGTSLLLARQPVAASQPGRILPLAGTLVAAAFTIADQMVSRVEGAGLLVVYGAFALLRAPEVVSSTERAGRSNEGTWGRPPLGGPWPMVGLLLVLLGSSVVVAGGDRILHHAGLLGGFVGAAVVAPAAAARLVIRGAGARGPDQVSPSFTLDAIAAFATGVMGAAALIRPLTVDAAASYALLAVAVGFAVVSVAFLATGRAGRVTGFLVLSLYGLWLALAAMA